MEDSILLPVPLPELPVSPLVGWWYVPVESPQSLIADSMEGPQGFVYARHQSICNYRTCGYRTFPPEPVLTCHCLENCGNVIHLVRRHFLNIPLTYKLGTRWIGAFPRWFSYALSDAIADLSFPLYRFAVVNVRRNLSIALPFASSADISSLTRRLFRNYGRYLVDYGRVTQLSERDTQKEIASFEGKQNIEEALRLRKGVILLTAHLGNWELGGIFFGSSGVPIKVVTLQDEDREIDRARSEYRLRRNVSTITVGDAPFSVLEIVEALKEGSIVAMLIDRNTEGMESIQADFFKRPTMFPRGPFVLSRLTGSPVVVGFVVKDTEGYKGIVEGPMFVKDESEEKTVLDGVVKILEKYITMYPDQWYNFTQI